MLLMFRISFDWYLDSIFLFIYLASFILSFICPVNKSSFQHHTACTHPRYISVFHSFHFSGKDIQLLQYVTFVSLFFCNFLKLFFFIYFFRKKKTYTFWAYLCLFYFIWFLILLCMKMDHYIFSLKKSQMAID